MEINKIHHGDALTVLKTMPDESVNCCVTSPPYWCLRDYGIEGQLGIEKIPEEYVSKMVEIFREVRRVLRDDGTLWLNLGDSYNNVTPGCRDPSRWPKQSRNNHKTNKNICNNLKIKDLVGVPWLVAFALRADGWYLRSDIIWHKPNPMPESVTDRPTKAHEYIFLMSKSQKYYYNNDAIREQHAEPERGKGEPEKNNWSVDCKRGSHETVRLYNPAGRNKRTVWTVATQPFKDAHFATFPLELIRPCILAGCPEGGIVLDPFMGAGTTAQVCLENDRNFRGIELNSKYIEIAEKRIKHLREQGKLFNGGHINVS